jgi:hypothetical protein
MTDRPQRVNVTIDRLVLRGFAPEQRDAIAAGLQAELQKQLGDPATGGQFGDSRSLASLRQRPMTLAAAAKPQQIGAQAGRQLARSIRS